MGSHSLELIMNGLVVLAACICASSAQIIARAALPGHQSHQFHAQDEFGQFSFGHAGGPSARTESRNAYGVTHGSYQYVDAYGIIQTVNYVSDAAGFRVAGSNLPVGPVAVVDTPEVAAAKAEFQAAFDAATIAAAAAPEEPAVEEVAEEAAAVVPAAGLLPYPYAAGVLAAAPADIVADVEPAKVEAVPAAADALPAAVAPAVASREATLTEVKLNP